MDKLLVICGPTATGKTSLALHLAKVFDGELISADSRQVYKGMDIGTGKDIPEDFGCNKSNLYFQSKPIEYYTNSQTRLWGLDIVAPDEAFSVAEYVQYCDIVIEDIISRKKLPILVGGTGLYIRAVVDGIETADITPDRIFRSKLESLTADKLFQMLLSEDPDKALSLNNSDKNNPRRLIRALEITKGRNQAKKESLRKSYLPFIVGLQIAKEELRKRIEMRVVSRINNGFEQEVSELGMRGVLSAIPSETIGYKQWIDYSSKSITREDALEMWKKAELQYAKRQMTWFQKDTRIRWFSVLESDHQKKVEEMVRTWYKLEKEGERTGK